ncbi:MAG: hypothetical protein QM764_10005 [Chitinophagaceae bacterium]
MRKFFPLLFSLLLYNFSIAQVPVSKEPRHHPVFANDKVRILNVLLPPGDTTLFHLHSTPSVFITLSKTKTGSQMMNGQTVPLPANFSVPGSISFENLSAPHTRTHRVWNVDTNVFHVVDVELFTKNKKFKTPPLSFSNFNLITDTSFVRVYKVELKYGESVNFSSPRSSFLLLALNNEPAELEKNAQRIEGISKPGDFIWLNARERLSISNRNKDMISFVLLEVK